MRILLLLFFSLQASFLLAQDFTLSGKVTDSEKNPISFVNILLYKDDATSPFKGFSSNEDGSFSFEELEAASYRISYSYVGFENIEGTITLSSDKDLGNIVLRQGAEMLSETVVKGKLPTLKKSAGKMVFNVENTSLSVGSTMDLLKKTPGVLIINDEIKVKFDAPTIFINGKRVYLSAAEVTSLLKSTDAANIKTIEVITNPSAKFDADAGIVLNIITSKAISIGYKGSVNATYEQAIYPKYSFGTSHFYKNKWLNLYASYNYNTRKEYKEDDSYTRFFQPDEVSTKSIWETDFNRTTDSENHNGHVVLDFALDAKNMLSLTSNVSISPNSNYNNHGESVIFNPQRQVDSTITTLSGVDFKKDNLTFALDYTRQLNENGASLSASANYIYYNNNQNQRVSSDYSLADNNFLRNSSFKTNSAQNSNIFTAQTDLATGFWNGNFETGFKFTNIDTESKLDFFDTENNASIFNNALSDDFNYKENVYAGYLNYERQWDKWSITSGLRGEYTDINAISRSLGEVNTQQYFKLFPSAGLNYEINENNSLGISYRRSIHRPRYESLNPFKYFITENNYKGGNPNLVPGIEDKISLDYSYKNKLFFSAYYQNVKNSLSTIIFQNNENSILRSVDDNLAKEYQYSFDIVYVNSLTPWWFFHITSSTFYLAEELYAIESFQDKYTNDTFGQYFAIYSNFNLSKDRSLSADLSALYISNFVFGASYFKNQNFVNLSVTKEFWDKRASLTLGIDDIFNTLDNLRSVTKYYNQDYRFSANQENRLFRVGFKYNFGNARLHDNNKQIQTDEGERLEEKKGL